MPKPKRRKTSTTSPQPKSEAKGARVKKTGKRTRIKSSKGVRSRTSSAPKKAPLRPARARALRAVKKLGQQPLQTIIAESLKGSPAAASLPPALPATVQAVPLLEAHATSKQRLVWLKKLHRPATYLIIGLIGLNLMIGGGLYLAYRKTILSFKVAPSVVAEAHLRAAEPLQITIPTAQIDLPVIPAQIKEGVWETSETMATHLYTSARPTEGGNIVIYAHNRKKMFANLRTVKVGEEVTVKTEKGLYKYRITEQHVVNPDQVELVLPTDHEVLTVYTCTGPFDSKRLVLKATPIGVSSL